MSVFGTPPAAPDVIFGWSLVLSGVYRVLASLFRLFLLLPNPIGLFLLSYEW